ncbi:hypothetical protein PL84_03695 [Vibrio anguillarum]|uniref:hypothetical protein n=1 Tax=Vibrio anguillarum TaxID=55601 RepID=UPI00097E2CEE|nr:hypothetical protein [Vibrio anguillarum]MBT2909685.1 hypothetical protein [Vibrio anguillarum]MBT2942464.1 hypothetical protein [Vibrio anguillarum]MBT2950712.1 hypothetical protein [Vibrio anguillarum]
MNALQILGHCALFWFLSIIGTYFLIGMFGRPNQFTPSSIFKEFSAAYIVVMCVLLFAVPKSDELRQLLWSDAFSITTLSVALVLFYSIAAILRRAPIPSILSDTSQKNYASLLFRDPNGVSRYLSINIEDLDLVMRAKKKLVAEVKAKETVLDALCRVQDIYEKGNYDLIVVNTLGSGYALRELFIQHFPSAHVIGSIPMQTKTDPDFELSTQRFA